MSTGKRRAPRSSRACRHVQARLDSRRPDEARAVQIYDQLLRQGWTQRAIIVAALHALDRNPVRHDFDSDMIAFLQLLFRTSKELLQTVQSLLRGTISPEAYQRVVDDLQKQFSENASDMFSGTFEFFDE